MRDINLHHEIIEQGLSRSEIERQLRSGSLTRVRRGAYSESLPADDTGRTAHRALLIASLRQLSDEAVASYVSAAVIHGLPSWRDQLARAHVTRDRPGGGRVEGNLKVHGSPFEPADVTTVGGVRVTSLARTVLDLSCTEPIERGVAVGDAALRRGLEPEELQAVIESAGRRRGIGRARTVAGMLDLRSESPGESVSRVRFWRWGLPVPVPQFVVVDPYGAFVARGDFGWPELGTIGEFDGNTKYGVLLRPGQTVQQAVLEEKEREDRIRDLGWQVVRWTWSDLANRAQLVARIEAAFRRGRDLR